jgi:hypothetical protein
LRTGVVAGVVIAVAVCAAIAMQAWTLGSMEGRWTYGYVRTFAWSYLLVGAAVAVACAALLRLPHSGTGAVGAAVVWVVFATGAHGVLRTYAPYDLETLFVSPGASSFYTFAHQQTPADILARFNRARQHAPLHARSNMPGKTMAIYALERVSARTDVLPWLLVAVSNAGALLMFAFVRELFRDNRVASYSAIFYLFTPARLFFFPIMNIVTPLFVLGCAWLVVRWLRTSRSGYAAGLGVALYALVFFEPLPLVMGLLFAALAAHAVVRGDIGWERLAALSALVVVVFIVTTEAVHALTGFQLVHAMRQLSAHAVEFNAIEGRPYGTWVVANLAEFFFAAGPAQLVIAGVTLWVACGSATNRRAALLNPAAVLCLGLFAVLFVTDIIGVNRGEVTRLWIFLACVFQIPAAYACAVLDSRRAAAAVLAVTVLQVSLAVPMIRFVVP